MAHQRSGIIQAGDRLSCNLRHGRFSPVGNEFDGVYKMFFFGSQTREAIFFGQVFDEDVFWQRLASGFKFKLGDLGAPGCDALAQGSLCCSQRATAAGSRSAGR